MNLTEAVEGLTKALTLQSKVLYKNLFSEDVRKQLSISRKIIKRYLKYRPSDLQVVVMQEDAVRLAAIYAYLAPKAAFYSARTEDWKSQRKRYFARNLLSLKELRNQPEHEFYGNDKDLELGATLTCETHDQEIALSEHAAKILYKALEGILEFTKILSYNLNRAYKEPTQ